MKFPRTRFLPGPKAPAWVLAETGTGAVFSLLSMLAVSRNIGTVAAGVGALAIATFLLLDLVGSTIMTDAVIQWRRLDQRHARSALTLAALSGVGTGLLLGLAGLAVARATGHGQIIWLCLAMAPLLPLSAFSGAAAGLVLREHRYLLLATRVFLGQPIGLACGLLLASEGAGPWAMMAVQAANTVIVFLIFVVARAVPLGPMLDRAALADLWPVAGPQLASVVMLAGRYRIFIIVLGMIAAAHIVAVCNVGFRLLDSLLMVVASSTLRITLPRLSALQDHPEQFAETYGETAQFQALLGWPMAAGVALTAHNLVVGLMGPQWQSAASGARIVACTALIAYSYGDVGSLWVAVGKTRINSFTSAAAVFVPVAGLLLLRPHTPSAAALCWGATGLLLAPPNIYLALRQIRRGPVWLLRHTWPAYLATACMVAAVLAINPLLPAAPLLALLCQAGVGAVVFIAVAFLALGRRLPKALHMHAPPVAEPAA